MAQKSYMSVVPGASSRKVLYKAISETFDDKL